MQQSTERLSYQPKPFTPIYKERHRTRKKLAHRIFIWGLGDPTQPPYLRLPCV